MVEPKIKAKCPSCKYNLILGSTNSTLTWVRRHEYMSYVHVECPRRQCKHHWFMFLDAEDPAEAHRMLKMIRQSASRWPTRVQNPTPQYVIDDYEEMAEITLLRPIELNPRMERHITTLRWELEGVVTPDDILSIDVEHHLPKGWL